MPSCVRRGRRAGRGAGGLPPPRGPDRGDRRWLDALELERKVAPRPSATPRVCRRAPPGRWAGFAALWAGAQSSTRGAGRTCGYPPVFFLGVWSAGRAALDFATVLFAAVAAVAALATVWQARVASREQRLQDVAPDRDSIRCEGRARPSRGTKGGAQPALSPRDSACKAGSRRRLAQLEHRWSESSVWVRFQHPHHVSASRAGPRSPMSPHRHQRLLPVLL